MVMRAVLLAPPSGLGDTADQAYVFWWWGHHWALGLDVFLVEQSASRFWRPKWPPRGSLDLFPCPFESLSSCS